MKNHNQTCLTFWSMRAFISFYYKRAPLTVQFKALKSFIKGILAAIFWVLFLRRNWNVFQSPWRNNFVDDNDDDIIMTDSPKTNSNNSNWKCLPWRCCFGRLRQKVFEKLIKTKFSDIFSLTFKLNEIYEFIK